MSEDSSFSDVQATEEEREDEKSNAALAATPWKYWGFESGDVNTGWEWGRSQFQPGATDRLVRSSSTLAEGDYALKATVKPGDLHSNGARSEVVQMPTSNPHFKEGDVVHYYWWTLFPSSFVTSPKWHVWTQWHQTNNNASPPPDLEFVLHGNTLGLRAFRAPNVSYTLWSETLKQGHWYRFQLIVKWSTSPTTGNVKLWVDGRHVVNMNHTTLATDSTPYSAYMKQGLYRDKTINHIQTIYHDGMAFHYH